LNCYVTHFGYRLRHVWDAIDTAAHGEGSGPGGHQVADVLAPDAAGYLDVHPRASSNDQLPHRAQAWEHQRIER
jgi:hypothetical protein